VVSVASRPDGVQVAPRDVQVQERDKGVLPDAKGEDETVLQQPPVDQDGQPPVVHGCLHARVQPPQETSDTGENPSGGGLILTVSFKEKHI
jgi:hypothetical protein